MAVLSSIVGGAGNDVINFNLILNASASDFANNTYYFGNGGGADVINFASSVGTAAGLTVAVSADFGSTGVLDSGVLTLGSNTITFTGGASVAGASNVDFVTVSQATIDTLG